MNHNLTLDQVKQHISQNLIPISNDTLGRRCGDGRDDQNIAEAIFGADLGYFYASIVAVRSMNEEFTTKENVLGLLEKVSIILSQETNGNLYVHTDDHSDQSTIALGCGFNKQARINPLYGLLPIDFEAVDEFLAAKKDTNMLKQAVYTGSHKEGAVVIVRSTEKSIKANDTAHNTSVFVLQETLVLKRLHDIAENLANTYHLDAQELETELVRAFQNHTSQTQQALAQGKPSFVATLEGENITVEEMH